jgi:5-formyltetrahydrofolate cyclo-ligase
VDPGDAKRRLRAAMSARRLALPPAERAAAGEAVARHMAAWEVFAAAPRLALYAALRGELPTAALASAARERGKELLWPRVDAADRLEFAPCADPAALVPGRHGVRVPAPDRPAVALEGSDLVAVPGLAFDGRGGRLGRGGGHYDRAFPPGRPDAPRLVGLGYAFQLIGSLPRQPHDRLVDAVATPDGVLACAGDRP